MSINSSIHPKYEGVAFKMFLTAATLLLMLASPAGSQEYGYSYLRMEVAGHPITNLVINEKYSAGWLEVLGVRVKLLSSNTHPKDQPKPAGETVSVAKADEDGWTTFPAVLRSGRSGPGKLSFGAGDSGGLDPLFEAQKHQSLIKQAELDFYTVETDKFVGRFKIKGIRILSLKDIPASACGAYEISLSFHSIVKE